ncbi:MAG: DUF4870 domain-containing protein [Ignavibacteriales bacterium]|nr:DUF4870 domain-containing protein [Ignavibacteriales bacterium]MCF8306625.1 DUF4870 domain-containing protein [Ignavibacteriales bacterium]MCF8316275.1 DUF4870 domain-containing protein [Ignavibacteriales bacterium]MCF8437859.1 DUF4870 domain-containing protein [Ignavibacteriales bacterium]
MNEITMSRDERLWGMLTHLSAFAFFIIPFGNIIGPLVIWLIKKEEYAFVEEQGKESINFQITVTIAIGISVMLIFFLIGIIMLLATVITGFIFVVQASIRSNDGLPFRYPYSIKIIK